MKFFVFLLQLLTLTLSDDGSNCVDKYLYFEEDFWQQQWEQSEAVPSFLSSQGSPAVRSGSEAVLPNGTRVNIFTEPSCSYRQVWLWLFSPVLFIMVPTNLNHLSLYALNHFTQWVPPHHTIATPLPCSAKAEEFFTLMTTSVSSMRTTNIQNVLLYTLWKLLVCSVWYTSYYLYQAVLPNGTRVNISTDPSCWADRQVCLWLSSPVSFIVNPTELNRLSLYTLNHFKPWVPPELAIATPLPCLPKAEGFHRLMTTSVSSTVNLQYVPLFQYVDWGGSLFAVFGSHCCCSSSSQLKAYAFGEMSKTNTCTIPSKGVLQM